MLPNHGRYIDLQVDRLLARARAQAQIGPPVDLVQLARLQRICKVIIGSGVADGALASVTGGFAVFLSGPGPQRTFDLSDRATRPLSLSPRQRFTLAHEIGHTLFFDKTDPPKPLLGLPEHQKLEALCHRAARHLLLPADLFIHHSGFEAQITTERVARVADRFIVSAEVVLNRLNEFHWQDRSSAALLLVRRFNPQTEPLIVARWLPSSLAYLRSPRPYATVSQWIESLAPQANAFENRSQCVCLGANTLRLRKVPYKKEAFFIEVELLQVG